MCVATGIYNNTVVIEADTLYFINQCAFDVALKIRKVNVRKFLFQFGQEFFKRHGAVNVRFAASQQVQVWSVNNGDLHEWSVQVSNVKRPKEKQATFSKA